MEKSRRLEFSALLKEALGSNNVYFQPPSDAQMQYPCIVYERDVNSDSHADDQVYRYHQGYQVTYIDHNPDSDVLIKLKRLRYSTFERHFATSGLNHDVFLIYH